jgi:hypothetical protein
MATELIDNYIDRESFRSDTEFAKNSLLEVIETFRSLKKTTDALRSSNSGLDTFKRIDQLNGALQRANKLSLEEINVKGGLNAKLAEEAKQRKQTAAAIIAEERAKQASLKTSQAEARASEQAARQKAKDAKLVAELSNDYLQLSKAYNEAALKAKNYALTLGESNPVTQRAVKNAEEMGAILKRVDASVGQFQRNVGNYASGFEGLGNSVNQITRELPAFSNSLQTGFLAISNNLPILFDEISRARQEINRLREAGEKAPTVMQALSKSFFSLGTALSLGVTLLTIYGKDIVEFFGSLIKGKTAIDEFSESQKLLNQVTTDADGAFVKATQSVTEMKIQVGLAKDGLVSKEGVVKQYNETLGKALGVAKDFNEVESIMADEQRTNAYVKAMLFRAAANLALEGAAKKALEAENTRIKNIEEFSKFGDDITISGQGNFTSGAEEQRRLKVVRERRERIRQEEIAQAKKDQAIQEGIAQNFLKQAGELETQFKIDPFEDQKVEKYNKDLDSARKAAIELRKIRLEAEAESLEDTIKAEGLGTKAREEAVRKRGQLLIAANELQRQIDLIGEKKSKEEIALINEQAAIDRANIEKDGVLEIIAIRQTGLAKAKQLYDEDVKLWEDAQKEKTNIAEEQAKEQATRLSNRQAALEQDRDIRLKALEGKRAAGLITEQQYNEQREKIINDSQAYLIRAEIDYVRAMLEIRKAAGENTAQEEAKLAALELKLQKDKNDAKIKQDEAYQRTRSAKLKELQGELVNLFTSVIDGAFERQKNALQDQIDLIEVRKQREIEAVNASLLSEQEKADKISVLNARAAAEREALQRRQRQVDQERARFEKAASIARVTQSTVEAVVATLGQKPWTPANIALATIIGAIGAAQIARIIATPIPRYKMGTDNHPGGLAIVGDGGKQEVVAMGGRAYLTPATDTMVDLPAGAKVYPSVDEFNANISRVGHPSIETALYKQMQSRAEADSQLKGAMDRAAEKIVKGMGNLPLQSFEIRDGELKTMVRNGQSFTEYVNKHIKL